MTRPICVINGPNRNRHGKREPEVCGTTPLSEVEAMCRAATGGHSAVARDAVEEDGEEENEGDDGPEPTLVTRGADDPACRALACIPFVMIL